MSQTLHTAELLRKFIARI